MACTTCALCRLLSLPRPPALSSSLHPPPSESPALPHSPCCAWILSLPPSLTRIRAVSLYLGFCCAHECMGQLAAQCDAARERLPAAAPPSPRALDPSKCDDDRSLRKGTRSANVAGVTRPSPGADVRGQSAVLVQMWPGRAQSRCGCGRGERSPGADVAGGSLKSGPMSAGRRRVALGLSGTALGLSGTALGLSGTALGLSGTALGLSGTARAFGAVSGTRSTTVPRLGTRCVLYGLFCMLSCVRVGAQDIAQKEGRTHR